MYTFSEAEIQKLLNVIGEIPTMHGLKIIKTIEDILAEQNKRLKPTNEETNGQN